MARMSSKAREELGSYTRDIEELGLAEPVTKAQLRQLHRVGWRGPTPCSSAQARAILQRLRKDTSHGGA